MKLQFTFFTLLVWIDSIFLFFYLQLAVPWLRNKLLSWAEKRFRVWPTYTRWGKCTETSKEPTSCFQTKVCRVSRNDKDFEIRRNFPLNWCSTVYIDFSYLIQEAVPLLIQIFSHISFFPGEVKLADFGVSAQVWSLTYYFLLTFPPLTGSLKKKQRDICQHPCSLLLRKQCRREGWRPLKGRHLKMSLHWWETKTN